MRTPGASPSPSQSIVVTIATAAQPLTMQGSILGTLQYMSPEQLEGREADARSDLFAFGAVLYEMATGRRAFEGKSQVSVIAAILEHDPPPVSASQAVTPAMFDDVIRICLAKNPDERWQTAADLVHELKLLMRYGSLPVPVAKKSGTRERIVWVGAVVLAAVVAAAAMVVLRRPADPAMASFEVQTLRPTTIRFGRRTVRGSRSSRTVTAVCSTSIRRTPAVPARTSCC